MIKNKILNSLQPYCVAENKVSFYFSGDVKSCFVLKTLLKETIAQVAIYYFDKAKFDANRVVEQERDNEIIRNYKSWYRDFEAQEINVEPHEIIGVIDLDDPVFHGRIFAKIYNRLERPAVYLILADDIFFKESPLQVLQLHDELQKTKHNCAILTPFSDVKIQEISQEVFSGYLFGSEINYLKIYHDNKDLIEFIKADSNKSEIEKLISSKTDLNQIFFYLAYNSSWENILNFIRDFGNLVSKEIFVYFLSSSVFPFQVAYEKAIVMSVAQGNISDEELNKTLLKIVDSFVGYSDEKSLKKVDEIDYFFRLYEHKITEETKDQLVWKCFYWQGDYYAEFLLDKLVSWNCDIGSLLLRTIDDFPVSDITTRAKIILTKYRHKIHQLQFNEALLKAFEKNLYELCHKLIEVGANQEILKFHNRSYAEELWQQKIGLEIGYKYNKNRRYKDSVIIAAILEELGNPQNKVPPVIHVTGSNGKGSTCAFLRSILEENGYKAHVFTTPGIIRNNEDIIVASQEIDDERYYDYLNRVGEAYKKVKDRPEFLEKISAANKKDGLTDQQSAEEGIFWYVFEIPAAVLAFAENKADATIIEVDTGGEFALTNVFDEKTTIATIVNTIVFGDSHAGGNWAFGDFSNIESVARTKSRLAKSGSPIFCAKQEDVVLKEIEVVAKDKGCELSVLGRDFMVEDVDENNFMYKRFGKKIKFKKPNLLGKAQINNAAIALTALMSNKKFKLTADNNIRAITRAYHLGRFAKIDAAIVGDGYEKLFFGSIKSRFGMEKSYDDGREEKQDAIIKITGNSQEFIGGDIINSFSHYNNLIFVGFEDDKVLSKQRGRYCNKNYLSSAIMLVINNTKRSKTLVVKFTGIVSFPREYLKIFNQLKQINFAKDLDFAVKNNLLNQDQVLLMNQ